MPNADYQSIYRGSEMDDRWGKAGTAVQGVKVNGTEVGKDAQNKVNLTLNKSTVGLGNVDNTSDANKPVSTAQAAAIAAETARATARENAIEALVPFVGIYEETPWQDFKDAQDEGKALFLSWGGNAILPLVTDDGGYGGGFSFGRSDENQYTILTVNDDDTWEREDKNIAGDAISAEAIAREQKEAEIDENLADKANKDGYYEQMGVGYAKSLLGNGAATQETIDFRPSGGTKDIGTGVETLKAIKGNSVVMNQLVQNGNFEDDHTNIKYGLVTEHSVSNNVLTFTALNEWLSNGAIEMNYEPYPSPSKKLFRFKVKAENGITIKYHWNYISGDTLIANGEWQNVEIITYQPVDANYLNFGCLASDAPAVIQIKEVQVINLTQMFGAGNEPTTTDDPRIKWLESFGYIPYNEGQLLNFKGEGLKTTGVNQFDGSKAQVISGTAYRILGTYATLKFAETLDGEQTDITPSSGLYTPPTNGYIFATGVSNEFQIAIEHSGGDIPNTYHPYEEHTLALPITSLKANGVTIFPDGMKSAGTAKDELYGNSLGVITKAIKRIGVVDLGSLNWYYTGTLFYAAPGDIKVPSQYNIICSKYRTITSGEQYQDTDKIIRGSGPEGNYKDFIIITDSDYTDTTTFKAAMSGVYAYYELATPIEYTLDTPINATTYVNDWGTEQNLPQGVDAQGLPKTTSLNAEIVYAPNVQDAIRNLPKNYIGKESMDAILNAFKTAGIIASFTLTYDATSGKYNCSITKQS